jgi:hypothetical protein
MCNSLCCTLRVHQKSDNSGLRVIRIDDIPKTGGMVSSQGVLWLKTECALRRRLYFRQANTPAARSATPTSPPLTCCAAYATETLSRSWRRSARAALRAQPNSRSMWSECDTPAVIAPVRWPSPKPMWSSSSTAAMGQVATTQGARPTRPASPS